MSATPPEKPRYMKRVDPAVYGFICSYCNKRFGQPNKDGSIEVIRCETCIKNKKRHRDEY